MSEDRLVRRGAVDAGRDGGHDQKQHGCRLAADLLEPISRQRKPGNAAGRNQGDETDRIHDRVAVLLEKNGDPRVQAKEAEKREEPKATRHKRPGSVLFRKQRHPTRMPILV